MSKRLLRRFFRVAGLSALADRLEYRRQQLVHWKGNRAFRKAYPQVALPPPYLMYEAYKLDYRKYYYGGRKTARWIREKTSPFLPKSGIRVLDWGCGPGRVIRHLPGILGPDNEYYGTDSNSMSIDWCKNQLSDVTFSLNGIEPPLPFVPGHFDLIYGISIFTHLSEARHRAWRDELFRVGKAGAVYLFTTQGEAFREKLSAEERVRFDRGQVVVRAEIREGHRSYAAFQPSTFMEELFSKNARIRAHIPGKKADWGIGQDTWIIQKCE